MRGESEAFDGVFGFVMVGAFITAMVCAGYVFFHAMKDKEAARNHKRIVITRLSKGAKP